MNIADKLKTVDENVPKVYESGYTVGEEAGWWDGYNTGNEDGYAEAQKDFWDAYQNKGKRTDLTRMFGSFAWTNENFKPQYDLKPTNAYGLFWGSRIEGDLVEILDNLGITLDFSNLSKYEIYAITNAFTNTLFTRIGVCDFRNFTDSAMQIGQVFMQSTKLVTIDKIIVNGHGFSSQAFKYCYELKNLTIEGMIGRNSDFSGCSKLSHDSLMSIINALAELPEGTVYTLTLGNTNLQKLTEAELTVARNKGWEVN